MGTRGPEAGERTFDVKFVAEMIVYNGRHIGPPIKEFTATSKPGKELKKFTITAKEYEGRVANSADMRIMVSAVSDGATHKDNNSGTFPLGGNGKKFGDYDEAQIYLSKPDLKLTTVGQAGE